jgi:hypothetical protein
VEERVRVERRESRVGARPPNRGRSRAQSNIQLSQQSIITGPAGGGSAPVSHTAKHTQRGRPSTPQLQSHIRKQKNSQQRVGRRARDHPPRYSVLVVGAVAVVIALVVVVLAAFGYDGKGRHSCGCVAQPLARGSDVAAPSVSTRACAPLQQCGIVALHHRERALRGREPAWRLPHAREP